ncbi:MAG: hypothetical protein ACJZ8O_12415 [Pirellulaceae bacterium]
MITVTCPSCNRELKLPDHLAGRQGKCPGCQNLIVIPAAPAAQQATPDAANKPLPPGVGSAPAQQAAPPVQQPPIAPAPQDPVQPPAITPPSAVTAQPTAPIAPPAPAQPPVINTQAPQPVQPVAPTAPIINTTPPAQPAAPVTPGAPPAPASPFVTPQAGETIPAVGPATGFPQIDTTGASNASPFPQINTQASIPDVPTNSVAAYQARQKGGRKKALIFGGGLLGIGAIVAVLFLFVFTGGGSNTLAGLTQEVLEEANSAIGSIANISDAGTAQSSADDVKALIPKLQDISKRFKDKVANTSKEDLLKEIEALLDDQSIKNELVSLIKQALPLQTKLENLPPDAMIALGTAMIEIQNSATTLGTDFEEAFSTLEAKIPDADIAPLLPKAINLLTSVMAEVPELGALMGDVGIPGFGGGFGGMFGGGEELGPEIMDDGLEIDGGSGDFGEIEPENPFE